MPFVELNRKFLPWKGKDPADIDARVLSGAYSRLLPWPDLLKSQRTILLAEAGSGKSEELAEQVKLLRAEGRHAFGFTVQDVSQKGLPEVLRMNDRSAFQAWKSSDDEAWFLIDSVDEAKWEGVRFESALQQISDGIYGAEDRAHIVLSSRYTDWEFLGDVTRFNNYLAPPAPKSASLPEAPRTTLEKALRRDRAAEKARAEETQVVLMASLNEAQVRQFAAGQGVKELDPFMRALETENLWSLARRPMDLLWLADFWKENKKFGPFSEMLKSSLVERLKEKNPAYSRSDPISPEHAMAALQRVGATFVFGRKDRLTVPDSERNPDEVPKGFDLEEVLPDWTPEHRKRFQARPVFDPETFGQVRLHNDNQGEVRSFLAAKWLERRRATGGCSVDDIFDLLFGEAYGHRVIKPSAAQTAAWLSIWDTDVAREVLAREPEILLSYGDPASLPLLTRHGMLRVVVDRIIEDGHGYRSFDRDQIRRLATPDMVPLIHELWEAHSDHEGVRYLLLLIIDRGVLRDCLAIARQAAFDESFDGTSRVWGGRAFLEMTDDAGRTEYAAMLKANARSLPQMMLWEALETLVPQFISASEFATIVAALDLSARGDHLGLDHHGPRIVAKLTGRMDLEAVVVGLLPELGAPPDLNHPEETEAEKIHASTVTAAAQALLDSWDQNTAPDIVITAALRLVHNRFFRTDRDRSDLLRDDLLKTSARRRIVLWRAVEANRGNPRLSGHALSSVFQLQLFCWTAGLQPEDLDWLLQDIETRDLMDDKLLALDGALTVWTEAGRPAGLLHRINAVGARFEQTARYIEAATTPREKTPQEIEWEREREVMQRQHADRQALQTENWAKFIAELQAGPEVLRRLPPPTEDGPDSRLYWLWQLLESQGHQSARYAINDITPVVPILGQPLAEALRDGLIAFWRHWKPKLVSERAPDQRNSIPLVDCMGIAGVSLEAAHVDRWAEKLSTADATRAAEFATLELNGFPDWLLALAAHHPAEVREVLRREIVARLDASGVGPGYGVIEYVAEAPENLAHLVAPDLLSELEARDEIDRTYLSRILSITAAGLDDPTQRKRLLDLTLGKFANGPLELAATYIGAAYRVDANAATEALNAKLDALTPREQSDLGKAVLPKLFGTGFLRDDVQPPAIPFEALERLVLLAFRMVRVEDDVEHPSGEVFSPDERDHAERARDAAFQRLVNSAGEPTVAALERLAQVDGFPVQPSRLRDLILNRAKCDVEESAWPAKEAYELEKEFDTTPQTPADLQRMAMRRFRDIDHDLHNAQFAQAITLKRLQGETEVQIWAANELMTRRGRAYTAVREPEVVDAKKPDIRLQASSADASLPIEVKVAETCSRAELENALNLQLGGRYLREKDANYGILLLVHKEARSTGWLLPDGTPISFGEVVAHLQGIADETAATAPDAPKAKIAVLDVSDVPLPEDKLKKSGRQRKS